MGDDKACKCERSLSDDKVTKKVIFHRLSDDKVSKKVIFLGPERHFQAK